ncbi:alpha/beta hydrolase [Sphaerisporangium aureirubrum]|uniref:Alpha/beta hydrolase n=1 Tax=Sphaerisporangium aureirubrum TaxID=1544736 RepID=A0ABW1NNE7_9ACTN
MTVRLDPELAAGLARIGMAGGTAAPTADELPGIRRQIAETLAAGRLIGGRPDGGRVRIADRWTPGTDGGPVRLRIFRAARVTGELPALYWVHGGGMVAGMVEMDDGILCRYAEDLGCVVVSVDYRLAPENPYPAAVEDCYAGLAWVAGHAAELGCDPGRLVVAGASAGGGLAAATVLLARDRGGPAPSFQLLMCPMLDDRNTTPSSLEFTDAIAWNRAANLFGWTALLGDLAGTGDVPQYAAPARADDLTGLPPAYVDVGELEVFRDECIDYAARLARAGVSTEFHLYPGAFHGFDWLLPDTALSRRAADLRTSALRRAFTA